MTLGQKIRMLRKEKNLTQAKLCGDFMTRNMLSQIESDSAGPSVATLRVLAERLGVPAGYLLEEDADLGAYRKLAAIGTIRQLYRESHWQKCLDACRALPDFDDEISLIMADCCLKLGVGEYTKGSVEAARRHFSLAQVFASRTLYPHEEIDRLSALYLAQIDSAASGGPPVQVADFAGESFLTVHEMAIYHHLLRIIDQSRYEAAAQLYDALNLKNPLYRIHISAKLSESAGNYERAADLLEELIDRVEDENVPPDFLLRVYADMESVCRNMGNFRRAYEAAQSRQACLDRFRAPAFVRKSPDPTDI